MAEMKLLHKSEPFYFFNSGIVQKGGYDKLANFLSFYQNSSWAHTPLEVQSTIIGGVG